MVLTNEIVGIIGMYLLIGYITALFIIKNVNKDVKEGKYKREKFANDKSVILAMLFLWPIAVLLSALKINNK
jgi:hypothetical protein